MSHAYLSATRIAVARMAAQSQARHVAMPETDPKMGPVEVEVEQPDSQDERRWTAIAAVRYLFVATGRHQIETVATHIDPDAAVAAAAAAGDSAEAVDSSEGQTWSGAEVYQLLCLHCESDCPNDPKHGSDDEMDREWLAEGFENQAADQGAGVELGVAHHEEGQR